jgi:hypothetical protein
MVFASSSDISFGDEMDDDVALESDTNAPVGLPATGEPLVLSTVLEVEEIPLPEELRAPVPHSPIWVPSPSPWPLEAAVASESVGLDLVDPPWVGLEMADLDEFSLEDVLQIHPAPEELKEEVPVFEAASGGDGSAFITSGAQSVGDAVSPSR